MRILLLKNWRDIKDRRSQFGALIVLVTLGIVTYVGLISAFSNLTFSYNRAKTLLKMASFETHVVTAPKSELTRIRALPGVEAAEGRLIIDSGLFLSKSQQPIARVVSVPPDHQPSVNRLLIDKGTYLVGDAKNECLLDKHYAEGTHVRVGNTIKLFINGQKKPVRVVGIVSSPEYLTPMRTKSDLAALAPGSFAVLFMTQSEVERLFFKPPSFNDFAVLVRHGWSRNHVIQEVEHVLGSEQIIDTVTQENQPSNFVLLQKIQGLGSIGYLLPFLILTIAAFSLSIAVTRIVQSQRGQIGLAKALGYGNAQILAHYLLFSLFIAFAGSAVGFAVGQLLSGEIITLYGQILGLPFLSNPIHPNVAIGAISLSSFAAIAAGLAPAYASARMPPALAMRADPNLSISKGSIPVIERIVSRFVRLPFVVKIPLRNVFRVRRRSVYTIIGISFAVLLTLLTWTFFDYFSFLLDKQFTEVERWDITAAYSQDFGRGRVHLVQSFDGVESVQPVLGVPVTLVSPSGAKKETGIIGMAPNATFHGFTINGGLDARRALEAGGLILTPLVAKEMGVRVGDSLVVETPLVKHQKMPVALLATSDELVGAPIFMSLSEARQLIRAPGQVYNALYLKVDPKKASDIKEKLFNLPGSAGVVIKQSFLTSLQSQLSFAYIEFTILFAFGFTVGFVVVYNTFTTNILERMREIATMRTIGEDRAHILASITLENLLLAVAAIPLGMYLGLKSTAAMYSSLSTEAFTIKAILYPASYVYIVVSILVVLLLSEIGPIGRIFRLDLAEATKILE